MSLFKLPFFKNVAWYIVLVLFSGALVAQSLTVESVKDSLLTRFNRIEDYTVNMKISVDMTGFRMPRKRIKLYYKSPDKLKIESRGFAVVPKTGLGGSPLQFFNMLSSLKLDLNNSSSERKHIHITGDIIPDSLQLPISEVEDFPGMNMTLSIDPEMWVITQVSAIIDTVTLFNITSDYTEIDGYFLPKKTILSLGLKGLEGWSFHDPVHGHGGREKFSETINGNGIESDNDETAGTITMEFSRYKVNRGLNDKFFEDSDW